MITILSGDPYLIREYKRQQIQDHVAQNGNLALHEIDLSQDTLEIQDLFNLLQSNSIFGDHKLIILHNLTTKIDFCDHIEELCRDIQETSHLLIIEPFLGNHELMSLLKKSSRFKDFSPALKQQSGLSDLRAFLQRYPGFKPSSLFLNQHQGFKILKPYTGVKLKDWLCNHAETNQTKLDSQTAEYLITRAGDEMLVLNNELQKLKVHPNITKKIIDDLVIPQITSQVFHLIDALMKGDLDKALNFHKEHLQQQKDPMLIIGALVWQLQTLVIARSTRNEAIENVASEYNIHTFALRKSRAFVQHIKAEKLNNLVRLTAQIDKYIKVKFMSPKEALLFLITKGCHL